LHAVASAFARLLTTRAAGHVRPLLALALVLGMLALQVERSTLAVPGFTVDVPSNQFTGGVVDLNCSVNPASSTCSSLPSSVAFTWSSTGAGSTDCANVLTGLDVRTQAMVPGHYCAGKVTIANNHPDSIDAWLRIRLVRRTPAGTADVEALNNRLRLYMSEYTAGTARTAAAYQAADCTAQGFRPNGTQSTASIPNVADAVNGSRTALTALTAAGKNIGAHPGVSSPADSAVTALLGQGLLLVDGSGAAPFNPIPPTPQPLPTATPNWTPTPGSAPTATPTPVVPPAPSATPTVVYQPGNMTTSLGARNAFNLVGNDEIHNPRRVTDPTATAGTRANGTNAEAGLPRLSVRYYCVGVFFPSDTDQSVANGVGDNAAAGASLTYHIVVDAVQQANNIVR
jgi:hypothetical protein